MCEHFDTIEKRFKLAVFVYVCWLVFLAVLAAMTVFGY